MFFVDSAVYSELAALIGGIVPNYRGYFLRGGGGTAPLLASSNKMQCSMLRGESEQHPKKQMRLERIHGVLTTFQQPVGDVMYTGQEITHDLTKTPYLTLPESSGRRKRLVPSTVQFATSSGLSDSPISENFSKTNFGASYYETDPPTGGVRRDKMYLLSKDGFIILTMGYTGKKAMAMKEVYIQAFNEMEALLRASMFSSDTSEAPATQPEHRHVTFRQVPELLMCPESNLKGLQGLIGFAAYLDGTTPLEQEERITAAFGIPFLEYLEWKDYFLVRGLADRQVFRIAQGGEPATEEERAQLEALLDFAAYMENRQDRDVMKRIVAYICNVPSLENLSARGVNKAVFAPWAFLNRFPPMNDDLLCNCSGQCKKEVFNG